MKRDNSGKIAIHEKIAYILKEFENAPPRFNPLFHKH